MRRAPPTSVWREWDDASGGPGGAVTSTRLDSTAMVRSRLFPELRSWFALGAPVELMSPLSVWRVLYALGMALWPITAPVALDRPIGPTVMAIAGAVMFCIWLLLLGAARVTVRSSHLLGAIWVTNLCLLIVSQHGDALSLACASLFVPVGVFAALFLGPWAVAGYQVLATAGLWGSMLPYQGVAKATIATLLGSIALLSASCSVLLLCRTVRRQGAIDPETGLPNGYGLADRMAELSGGPAFAVAVVLLAGVAEAREALGFRIGTELLRRAVEDLGQVLPSGAVIGRVEGDELVVAADLDGDRSLEADELQGSVPPSRLAEEAATLAQTLARAIGSGRYLVGQVEVALRAHVGLALAPWDGAHMPELVRRASLSAARAAAGGRVQATWDGERGALTADDLSVLADLRLAIERGELSLAYQPQVDARTRRTASVESLLRWYSQRHGYVPPGRFIPLAERTGLIGRLTDWVICEALDAQYRWRSTGLDLPVSVNLSASVLTQPGLSEWILGELRRRRLPPDCLAVEVTETTVLDVPDAVQLLEPLRHAGVRVSIDDFGMGYTSLAALPRLPLSELKVDQHFVLRSVTSAADQAIVRTVQELAHRLGLVAVAEGVENAELCELMSDIGFDLLQGYYLARPMSERDLLDYVGAATTAPPHDHGPPARQSASSAVVEPSAARRG